MLESRESQMGTFSKQRVWVQHAPGSSAYVASGSRLTLVCSIQLGRPGAWLQLGPLPPLCTAPFPEASALHKLLGEEGRKEGWGAGLKLKVLFTACCQIICTLAEFAYWKISLVIN